MAIHRVRITVICNLSVAHIYGKLRLQRLAVAEGNFIIASMIRLANLLALIVTLSALSAAEAEQPYPGLEWNDGMPSALAMSGRLQLFIFHRSDDAANRWYGTLKQQLSEAFADDYRLLVIEVGVGDTKAMALSVILLVLVLVLGPFRGSSSS